MAGAACGAEDVHAPQDPQGSWHRIVILCGKQLFRMQLEVDDLLTHCPGSALLSSPFPLLWGEASLREGCVLARHSPQLCPRQLVQVAAFVLFLRQIVFTSILPASPQWDTFFPESLTCVHVFTCVSQCPVPAAGRGSSAVGIQRITPERQDLGDPARAVHTPSLEPDTFWVSLGRAIPLSCPTWPGWWGRDGFPGTG